MPIARHRSPDLKWSFELPDRLKIATALIFEAAVSREAAERRLIDDLLGLFGGRSRPIMAHLIESGTLTLEDVREAEKTLLKLAGEEKPE